MSTKTGWRTSVSDTPEQRLERVRAMDATDRLLYWINERDTVATLKKLGRKKPWTQDPILQNFRFTNVRRMDDKVSVWLLKNWYEPNFNHSNMLLAAALARFINLPASLEQVGFPKVWNVEFIKNRLRSYRDAGNTIFNGAYMVRGNDGMDKIECVLNYYVQPLVDNPPKINQDSMEKAHAELASYYGWGSFMAGQVVADLRWAMRGSWEDKLTWAPMGPGSKRGMNRLLGLPPETKMSQREFLEMLGWVIDLCKATFSRLCERLEAIDYQSCMCEWDKYERILWGQGRAKQRYPGVTN